MVQLVFKYVDAIDARRKTWGGWPRLAEVNPDLTAELVKKELAWRVTPTWRRPEASLLVAQVSPWSLYWRQRSRIASSFAPGVIRKRYCWAELAGRPRLLGHLASVNLDEWSPDGNLLGDYPCVQVHRLPGDSRPALAWLSWKSF